MLSAQEGLGLCYTHIYKCSPFNPQNCFEQSKTGFYIFRI